MGTCCAEVKIWQKAQEDKLGLFGLLDLVVFHL